MDTLSLPLATRRGTLQAMAASLVQVGRAGTQEVDLPRVGGRRFVGPSGSDDHGAIQGAVDALALAGGGEITLAPAAYRLSNTLIVRSRVSLIGAPGGTTLSFVRGIDGLRLAESPDRGRLSVRDLVIDGEGEEACTFSSSHVSSLSGVGVYLRNIAVRGRWTNGFTFANLYGGGVADLSTDMAECRNACFRFLGALNGQVFSGLYTGHSTKHLYCFYFDMVGQAEPGGNLPPGLGNIFTGLVAQGGKYGIYIRCGNSMLFLSPYCENVARPLVIGTRASDRLTTGIEITGAVLGGAEPSNPYIGERGPGIEIEYARGVRISTPDFRQSAALIPLQMVGGGGTGAAGVALVGNNGRVVAASVCAPGQNYSVPPAIRLSGTARLVARVEGGRVVGIDVVNPGEGYKTGSFPVALLYGPDCRAVRIELPYSGFGPDIPFSALLGRKQDANPGDGVTVQGMTTTGGADLSLAKADGIAHEHVLTWHSGAGWQSIPYFPAMIDQ